MRNLALALACAVPLVGCADPYGRPNPAGYALSGAGIGGLVGGATGLFSQKQYDNYSYGSGYNSGHSPYGYGRRKRAHGGSYGSYGGSYPPPIAAPYSGSPYGYGYGYGQAYAPFPGMR